MVIRLAVAHHPEQVDSGIPLLVDDSPVERGHVIETLAVDSGEGMSYLKIVV